MEGGAVISHLHNLGDVLVMISKTLNETNLDKTTGVVFVLCMIVWFYTRLVVFPWVAWWGASQDIDMINWMVFPFFGFGLFCLVLMHAYWFSMFVQVLYHFVTRGEGKDMIEADLDEKAKADKADNIEKNDEKVGGGDQ